MQNVEYIIIDRQQHTLSSISSIHNYHLNGIIFARMKTFFSLYRSRLTKLGGKSYV